MQRITLSEELRLIERSESEVSGAWKGAHLLLFFLAFVFGSFCTFCFHMLMYLFDEKCVLFPKLLSLTSLRHNVIYEFIPEQKGETTIPVDFLSTQFVEKSACYLPTYVPLVSGIFGLVWTTMFLMCSSGSRSLSGLQRPWRVIPPVLVFSVAMSCLCIYSSVITHYGIRELCVKLGTVTGSPDCSYAVNVATLAYERQIRGVYQATRLTVTSAWMHTACWVASAVLAIVRILMAVDFRLVMIRAELIGDIDRMLERNEEHLRTVMPSRNAGGESQISFISAQVFFQNERYEKVQKFGQLIDVGSDILFTSGQPEPQSEQALLPEERNKSARVHAYETVEKKHRFIVNMLYDLLDSLDYLLGLETMSDDYEISSTSSSISSNDVIARQFGQQFIWSKTQPSRHDHSLPSETASIEVVDTIMKDLKRRLLKRLNKQLYEIPLDDNLPSTSRKRGRISFESELTLTSEMQQALKEHSTSEPHRSLKRQLSISSFTENESKRPSPVNQKSNLKNTSKNVSSQTEKKHQKKQKVTIIHSKDSDVGKRDADSSSDSKKDEHTQTKPKEKQD